MHFSLHDNQHKVQVTLMCSLPTAVLPRGTVRRTGAICGTLKHRLISEGTAVTLRESFRVIAHPLGTDCAAFQSVRLMGIWRWHVCWVCVSVNVTQTHVKERDGLVLLNISWMLLQIHLICYLQLNNKSESKHFPPCISVCVCLPVCCSSNPAPLLLFAFSLEQHSGLWQPRGFEWHWGCRLVGCVFPANSINSSSASVLISPRKMTILFHLHFIDWQYE